MKTNTDKQKDNDSTKIIFFLHMTLAVSIFSSQVNLIIICPLMETHM